jgi:hypothetical protein
MVLTERSAFVFFMAALLILLPLMMFFAPMIIG